MKILNKIKYIAFLGFIFIAVFVSLVVLTSTFSTTLRKAYATATAETLGTAGSFSALAGLSMSATVAAPGTHVTGNLGLSPGLAGSRTGNWTVGGSEYFGTGGLSESAQADALTAFNNLAGQTPPRWNSWCVGRCYKPSAGRI